MRAVVCTDGLNLKQRECGPYWHYARLAENVRVRDSILLMESAGLLLPLTEKMLSLAVDGLSEIKTVLPFDFRLAVNVTPALLVDSAFTQMCLSLAGHDNVHLVLELTEQQPFNMDRQMEQMLNRLSDAGVKFALDDFGTGCSVVPKKLPCQLYKDGQGLYSGHFERKDIPTHCGMCC